MQSKHDSLLKRVDELDTECEQLRERVMNAEGEKDELQGVVEDLQTEKEKLCEELDSKQVCYSFVTAISRKVVGKNVHTTIPKGYMGYDQFTVPDTVAVEPTFVAFL